MELINIEFRKIVKDRGEEMLISKDTHPNESVLYISGCLLNILKEIRDSINIEALLNRTNEKFNLSLNYIKYNLALNFLFLINKVEYIEDGVKYVY